MKSIMLWLCILATGISLPGCDMPSAEESDNDFWACTRTNVTTTCEPITEKVPDPPCIKVIEFGCKPFVDCMPTAGGYNYIKSKKVKI